MSRIMPSHRPSWRLAAAVALATIVSVHCASPAVALSPESPEVRAAVAKAVAFLEKTQDGHLGNARPGAKALVGIVMIKAGKPDHPRVQEAVQAIKGEVLNANSSPDVYTLGLCLIFLTEPELPQDVIQQNSELIVGLVEKLKSVQKAHGGWGYPSFTTGDTSMTQYAALGLWSAEAAGYEAPLDVWERLTNWLIRTQAANGAFGYQGNDPGAFDRPAPQERTTLSMCAAGAASLYVCADHFKLINPELESVDDTPAALKRVPKKKNEGTGIVDVSRLKAAIDKSDQLLNNFVAEPKDPAHPYPYYYIYASERYRSFRDYANGKLDKEPDWYTTGARHLMSKQGVDGSWLGHAPEVGVVPDTCFATLFLLRSMRKAIEHIKHLGPGTLIGGRGLPQNMNAAEIRLGGVRAKKNSGPAMQLLSIMGDPNDPKFEQVLAGIEEDGIPAGDETMSDVAKRLRDLAKGQSPEARAAALQALARTRDLNQVPLLIEALKDSAPHVISAANEGLRFISRKFYGAGFWGGSDEKPRRESLEQWKKWYLSIRPDAVLAD